MFIEPDEDYQWADGQPLIFRRCSSCGNEAVDPKRNPNNLEMVEKEKKHGTG
jgi:ribosomal protein L24E